MAGEPGESGRAGEDRSAAERGERDVRDVRHARDGEARSDGDRSGADRPGSGGAGGPAARRPVWLLAIGSGLGLALAAFGIVSGASWPGDDLPPGVLALVNGEPIRVDEYRRVVEGLERDLRGPVDEERRRHVLDRMIEEELLVQRAMSLDLPRLDRKLRGDLTSTVIASVVASAEDREPSDDELRRFFEEERAFFLLPPRLRVHQVWLRVAPGEDEQAVRARAEEARARLEAGEPFAVVRAGFGDPEISPVPDALLPPAKLREYVGPSVLAAALDLPVGGVSEPIRSGTGWHVVVVEERAEPEPPDFDSVRTQVAAEWRRRAGDRALRDYLDELRAQADVVTADSLP